MANLSLSTPSVEQLLKKYPSTEPDQRFFIMKRCPENSGILKTDQTKKDEGTKDLLKVSALLIHKTITSIVGEVKNIKKTRSGEVLVEVMNSKQATLVQKIVNLGPEIKVTVTPHRTLNISKGVISEEDLIFDTEEDILAALQKQKVNNVKRIFINRDGKKLPTKHIILTFDSPTLPKSVKIAYLNAPIRPYIPNPLQCFKCQKFGHSKNTCRNKSNICAKCSSLNHITDDCDASKKCCPNCQGEHPAYARVCPKWQLEKEIQTTKVKNNISFPEARKIVNERTPTIGKSYASAVKKTYATKSVQTKLCSFVKDNDNKKTATTTTLSQKPAKKAKVSKDTNNEDDMEEDMTDYESGMETESEAPKIPVEKVPPDKTRGRGSGRGKSS